MLLYVGSMDEVNQEVNITWVQPRVLGLNQVCVISFLLYEYGYVLVVILYKLNRKLVATIVQPK